MKRIPPFANSPSFGSRGAALHYVRVACFHAERERGQRVRHEVYPENMDRLQRRAVPEHDTDENREDLAGVARKQEQDRLLDVVVNDATFFYRADYRLEVVVGKDHVGGALRDVGAGDAHRHADVGALQARRVVHAVAGHRHDMARGAERLHDAHLVLGRNAREHAERLGPPRQARRPSSHQSRPRIPPDRGSLQCRVPSRSRRPYPCGRP